MFWRVHETLVKQLTGSGKALLNTVNSLTSDVVGSVSLDGEQFSAPPVRFLGTTSHLRIWLLSSCSIAPTLVIVMVYTYMGQGIWGRSPNWKHHTLNFPDKPELSIAWRPSDRTLCISFPLCLSVSGKAYYLSRLFTGCSCKVGVCSSSMMKLWRRPHFGEWHASTLCCLELRPCPLDELRQTLQERTGWIGVSHETGNAIHEGLHKSEDASIRAPFY